MASQEEERLKFLETVRSTLEEVKAHRCSNEDLLVTQHKKIQEMEAELLQVQALLDAEREQSRSLRAALGLMHHRQAAVRGEVTELKDRLNFIFQASDLNDMKQLISERKDSRARRELVELRPDEYKERVETDSGIGKQIHSEVDSLSREVSFVSRNLSALMLPSLTAIEKLSASLVSTRIKGRQCCAMAASICDHMDTVTENSLHQELADEACEGEQQEDGGAGGVGGSEVKSLHSSFNLWRMFAVWEPRRRNQNRISMLRSSSKRSLAQSIITWNEYATRRKVLYNRESVIKRNKRKSLMRKCFSAIESCSSSQLLDPSGPAREGCGEELQLAPVDVAGGGAGCYDTCLQILTELCAFEGTANLILDSLEQVASLLKNRTTTRSMEVEGASSAVSIGFDQLCNKTLRLFERQLRGRKTELSNLQAEMENLKEVQRELARFKQTTII